ncbi:MAG: hypothetical protein SRB1_01426 [Desulfobacteraceae bacterium Eth-SRB1]|nr:MAG: hypothetical protein SRB1_01426 [Desulfobacteraceae bacterium Eth-SRB1]
MAENKITMPVTGMTCANCALNNDSGFIKTSEIVSEVKKMQMKLKQ